MGGPPPPAPMARPPIDSESLTQPGGATLGAAEDPDPYRGHHRCITVGTPGPGSKFPYLKIPALLFYKGIVLQANLNDRPPGRSPGAVAGSIFVRQEERGCATVGLGDDPKDVTRSCNSLSLIQILLEAAEHLADICRWTEVNSLHLGNSFHVLPPHQGTLHIQLGLHAGKKLG